MTHSLCTLQQSYPYPCTDIELYNANVYNHACMQMRERVMVIVSVCLSTVTLNNAEASNLLK